MLAAVKRLALTTQAHRLDAHRRAMEMIRAVPFGVRWSNGTGRLLCLWLYWLSGPLIALAVTNQWFSPGRVLAGGDNFPTTFINPQYWVQRMRYSWDLTGLGQPGSLIQLAPQILVVRFLHAFLPAAAVQHAFITLLLAAQFLGMMLFIHAILPRHRSAAFVGAVFYCFNPFSVLVPPGTTGLFLQAYLPCMAALFIWTTTKPLRLPLVAVLVVCSSMSGILFINPPTFAIFLTFTALIILYVIARHRQEGAKLWVRIALVLALCVLANVYWIAQAYFYLFGDHQAAASAATNVEAWGGIVARRSSILNMFWLNPTWAWDYYFPYAPIYSTPLLLVTIFVPAILAFSALLNRAIPRYIVLPAAVIGLGALLVSTGLHGPWQSINLFLYEHVPLFWLFREPDTKFPPLILIMYAPLIGYQAEWMSRQAMHALRRSRLLAAGAGAAILAALSVAFLIAAFPLVTGAVVGRGYSGSDQVGVAIPSYWSQLGRYFTRHDPHAGILLLPNDDYYQMRYDWDYYGADSLASEMLPNRVIPVGGQIGYTSGSLSYASATGEMLRMFQGQSRHALVPYLAALGIRYIVERRDIVYNAPGRQVLSPQQVHTFLSGQQGVRFVRTFGKLDLYKVEQPYYVPPIYAIPLPRNYRSGTNEEGQITRVLAQRLGLTFERTSSARQAIPKPRIMRVATTQQTPLRMSLTINVSTQPLFLVQSTSFSPTWHACIIPAGEAVLPWTCWFSGFVAPSRHLHALGFLNGWIIEHPGRYTVIIDYGFQHIADLGILLSILTMGSVILVAVSVWIRRAWKRCAVASTAMGHAGRSRRTDARAQ